MNIVRESDFADYSNQLVDNCPTNVISACIHPIGDFGYKPRVACQTWASAENIQEKIGIAPSQHTHNYF